MWSLRTPRGRSLAVARLPAVVGSAREADVCVPHESVAAEHARLRAGEDGSLVVEAVGDAVVGCGGRRVRIAALQPGDELILGRVRFTLVRGDGPSASPPAAAAATATPATARPARPVARSTAPVGTAGAADELLVPRGARALPTRRGPPRRGLLHADLSQYTIRMRLLIALALLLVCAAVVAGIAFAVGLLG
jgi:hypothetical protein